MQVRAVNATGQSDPSSEVTATPISPPEAPTGFAGVPGPEQLSLSWVDPGDSSITLYQYLIRNIVTGSRWSYWTDIPGSDASTVA